MLKIFMFARIPLFLTAKFRALWCFSWFLSPRPDVLSGFNRWTWLARQRRDNKLVEPSVELRLDRNPDDCISIGPGSHIDKGTILWISTTGNQQAMISIGSNSYVGPYSYLGSCHSLVIENDVLIGFGCYIITVNHRTSDRVLPVAAQGYIGGDVVIKSNAWIGANVTVLPGITIGSGSIIGAGSVVTKSVPSGEVWAGVPARRIK